LILYEDFYYFLADVDEDKNNNKDYIDVKYGSDGEDEGEDEARDCNDFEENI
jgi:hypothetical protein